MNRRRYLLASTMFYSPHPGNNLLMEDGFNILLENGVDAILLE